jgi:hypothetical protein
LFINAAVTAKTIKINVAFKEVKKLPDDLKGNISAKKSIKKGI